MRPPPFRRRPPEAGPTRPDSERAEGSFEARSPRDFPCMQCGASVEFRPGSTSLVCAHCGSVNEIPEAEERVEEIDFHEHLARAGADEPVLERTVVKCPSCAAETTLRENATSDACPYCGTPLVAAEAHGERTLRPRSLLPFRLDAAAARERFAAWIRGLWFAPNGLARFARADHGLEGVYVPYWTYDCRATTSYRGMRGDDYWVSESYTTRENGRTVTRTRQVRKTRWRPASGTVRDVFDDVLVVASRALPRELTEALEPWDLGGLLPYDDRFLAGFRSERYSIDVEAGFARAREIMDVRIRETICRDIGGDHQRILSTTTRHDDLTFKHVLLPIWIGVYRHRDRVFRYLVNARTGEVKGERPWSWVKIAFAMLAAAIVGLVIWRLEGR